MTIHNRPPPLISVVLAVYNGERYIRASIESILWQTIQDFELIVINDGSSDGVSEILEEFSQDARVRVVENSKNLGLTKSLNIGLGLSRGAFIARQDADDISVSERFEKQTAYLERNSEVGAVGSYLSIIDENGTRQADVIRELDSNQLRHFQKGDTALIHGSLMIRRDVIDLIGGYDEDIRKSQDYDLLLRISEVSRLGVVPEILYFWRNHKDSISNLDKNDQYSYVAASLEKAKKRFLTRRIAGRSRILAESESPAFSVIMANYNNEKYIAEAIDSVLNQTAQNWELVICDDSSTDNSLRIIEAYQTDSRIRLVKNQSNRGYIGTLNRLLTESRGAIIGTLDPDDALTYDAIETMIDAHDTNPESPFVYSQFLKCNDKLRTIGVGFCEAIPTLGTSLDKDCVSHFRTWKRWASEEIGGFSPEIVFAEDKDFIFRMEEIGNLVFVDEALYRYRILAESQSHGKRRALALASHQLARLRAWERREVAGFRNISRYDALESAWFGLGLAMRSRDSSKMKSFVRWIIANPDISSASIRRFIDGLKGYC